MPRTMGVFVQSALLSLLIVGCHCQNIRVSVHGQDQSLSEATDCGPEARPDPRWTVRGTVDGGATSADWIIARDNIPGAGYQGITEDNLINAQSVPRSAVLFVQLDAFEFDPPDCKAFFSNNPLDGSCNGFGRWITFPSIFKSKQAFGEFEADTCYRKWFDYWHNECPCLHKQHRGNHTRLYLRLDNYSLVCRFEIHLRI